jgi:anti-anti-sigma factor
LHLTPPGAAESPSAATGLFVDVDTKVSRPRRRLRLHGELDLATVPLLASTLDQQAVGCTELEVDLSDVTFCDLIGLTALEQAQQRLFARGCSMTVKGIHGQLRRLLDLDGLRSPLSAPAVTGSRDSFSLGRVAKLLAAHVRLR